MKLTPKQELFVKEYIVDWNATQAATRAGYSEKTARQIGADCLSKVVIQKAIEVEMQARTKAVDITIEDILQDIKDTRETCKKFATTTDFEGKEKIDTGAINGRNKANEMLGKYKSMFTEKIEHSGKLETEQKLNDEQLQQAIDEAERRLRNNE